VCVYEDAVIDMLSYFSTRRLSRKPKFSNMDKVKVIADPEYKVYDSFGIGQLGYGGLFSMSMVTELRSLASKGIKNTQTGQGSNRWQNSGKYTDRKKKKKGKD